MNQVTLPIELSNPKLSLDEIGAIFILMSLSKLKDDVDKTWRNDVNLQTAVGRLLRKGYLIQDLEQGDITIDLTKIQ